MRFLGTRNLMVHRVTKPCFTVSMYMGASLRLIQAFGIDSHIGIGILAEAVRMTVGKC